MRKTFWVLMLMLCPRVAFAFMDAPTVTAIFPTYLILLVPMVVYELATVSRKFVAPKTKVLGSGILIHMLTFVTMILGGWFQEYLRDKAIHLINLKTIGISFLSSPPSALDIAFSLSIGSVVLIQEATYRWLNLIVIAVFLLPAFLLSRIFGVIILQRSLSYVDKKRLQSTVVRIKGIEYGLLVIASFLYMMWFYEF